MEDTGYRQAAIALGQLRAKDPGPEYDAQDLARGLGAVTAALEEEINELMAAGEMLEKVLSPLLPPSDVPSMPEGAMGAMRGANYGESDAVRRLAGHVMALRLAIHRLNGLRQRLEV